MEADDSERIDLVADLGSSEEMMDRTYEPPPACQHMRCSNRWWPWPTDHFHVARVFLLLRNAPLQRLEVRMEHLDVSLAELFDRVLFGQPTAAIFQRREDCRRNLVVIHLRHNLFLPVSNNISSQNHTSPYYKPASWTRHTGDEKAVFQLEWRPASAPVGPADSTTI